MGKIAIYAGHNRAGDGGGNALLNEDAVIKEAMLLAVDYAQRCGHTVIGGTNALGKSINERCTMANNGGAQGMIEFHGNIGGGTGGETYYDAQSNESAKLAAYTIASATGGGMSNKRGAKPDSSTRFGSLGILRGTSMRGVLHELFFLDNPADVAIWNANKKALVESIMQGFLQGLGLGTAPVSGGASAAVGKTEPKVKQLTRYWVGWNVGKDFTKIQEYRVNMNKALKIDYLDIFYFEDAKGDWRIGVDNLDHTGLENYRLRLMQAYGLSASQMEGKAHEVDSYLFGYKDITLEQLQNIRVRWTRQLGIDESRLSQRQNGDKHSIFVGGNSMREVQHWMVGQNQANADMNIADKRHYEFELEK